MYKCIIHLEYLLISFNYFVMIFNTSYVAWILLLIAFRKVSIEDFGIDPLIWLCSPMRRKSDVAHSGRIERKGKQKHQLFDKCFFCYDSDNWRKCSSDFFLDDFCLNKKVNHTKKKNIWLMKKQLYVTSLFNDLTVGQY